MTSYEEMLREVPEREYEHSEVLLYHASILDEAGEWEKCLEFLGEHASQIVDRQAYSVLRGACGNPSWKICRWTGRQLTRVRIDDPQRTCCSSWDARSRQSGRGRRSWRRTRTTTTTSRLSSSPRTAMSVRTSRTWPARGLLARPR